MRQKTVASSVASWCGPVLMCLRGRVGGAGPWVSSAGCATVSVWSTLGEQQGRRQASPESGRSGHLAAVTRNGEEECDQVVVPWNAWSVRTGTMSLPSTSMAMSTAWL